MMLECAEKLRNIITTNFDAGVLKGIHRIRNSSFQMFLVSRQQISENFYMIHTRERRIQIRMVRTENHKMSKGNEKKTKNIRNKLML